nr:molybdenum cofactor guanylyltransferase [Tissierella simiarum]
MAGGKSSRMGFDKQFIEIHEKRLMDILIHELEKEFDEIIIVTNKLQCYLDVTHKVAKDILKEKGPLGGIHVGLKEASSKYSFVVACDMPNINIEYVKYMKKQIENMNIDGCVTKCGNWIEPFSSFYSKDIVNNIEKHLLSNKRSIYSLLEKLNIFYIEEKEARKFSPNWDMFLNLNTKEDLSLYLENYFNNWSR